MRLRLSGPKELWAVVDEEDYRTLDLGSYTWRAQIIGRQTYAVTDKNNKMVYLHRLIMGLLDAHTSDMVDHIDHDGLNNSRDNLRKTDRSGNFRNARKTLSATTSSYKGVSWHKPSNNTNPWLARIYLSGKSKHLGCYRTEIEAALAYNKAAKELFGLQACLNDLSD